jgi:4-amino-4-deoxy-L-arabinose transferase-like glycosyltransferase
MTVESVTAAMSRAARSRLESTTWVLPLLGLWLLATLGLRPLLVPDEGRYANVAREMLLGDGLVPTLNGLPFFHKPPLTYWLDMAAMQVLGVNAFAARFAPALGAWLMGAALWFALRRRHGPRTASIGLGVLATCPFYFVAAQYANHDMLVAGLITLAVLAFARAIDDTAVSAWRVSRRWLVVGWVACALAVLAKGLIGIVLPALIVAPWLLATGRWRQLLALLHPSGWFAFVLVAAPWFIAMQMRYPGFFDYFVVEQHFRRYAQSNFNNVHPFWFFLLVLPAFTLPWSGWLPSALRRATEQRSGQLGLYGWWVVAVVLFFSLPASKLVGYVLPALTPWCALLAPAVARGSAWRWVMALSAVVCVGIVVALAWTAPQSNRAAGLALGAALAPQERVVFVNENFYDIPFYARLAGPVIVASDWADPEVPRRDNWRKELFDAARFDAPLARELLWPIARLSELSCGTHTVWYVVPAGQGSAVEKLLGISQVYADKRTELWRAAGRSC